MNWALTEIERTASTRWTHIPSNRSTFPAPSTDRARRRRQCAQRRRDKGRVTSVWSCAHYTWPPRLPARD